MLGVHRLAATTPLVQTKEDVKSYFLFDNFFSDLTEIICNKTKKYSRMICKTFLSAILVLRVLRICAVKRLFSHSRYFCDPDPLRTPSESFTPFS